MLINEIFHSIQGEGPATGEPCTFVRTSHCNLKCDGCDTDHSFTIDFSIRDIAAQCNKNDLIVITGGEPTLQTDLDELIKILFNTGHIVDIETNGTNQISGQSLSLIRNVVCSPKRGSKTIIQSNYNNLWYKFVIGSNSWTWTFSDVEAFLKKLPANMRHKTYLMPFGTDLMNARATWDYCANNNLRYSDRLQWRVNRK
jgi:organic radical activating enzyme